MNFRNPVLNRRAMLRGMGVTLALPLLESVRPVLAGAANGPDAASGNPQRMAFLYMPNGVNSEAWGPKGAGTGFELSPTLQPLAPFKKDLLVFTELWNQSADTGDGHYVKTGGWLTGTTITKTTGSDLRSGGVSVDQIAAQRIGNLTPLPSIELGIDPVTTGVDVNVGYTRLYGSHISWSSPVTPVAKEINPQLAFDRLFRSGAADRAISEQDSSVIDAVLSDAKRLRARVSRADQAKLDEYLESVRSVEKRIAFEARRKRGEVMSDRLAREEVEKLGRRIHDYYNDPAKVSERTGNHTGQVRLMMDILWLAFWTDSTRIGTFMFGNAVSGRNFSFLEGVKGSHHEISHHEKKPEKLAQYALINRWHVEQYAYLLDRLTTTREGEGTLLDNSMIVFGAGMRDGNSHNPHNLPVVLAGRAGGRLATGRHLVYEKNTPLCGLYQGMLHRLGVRIGRIGDGVEELPGLEDPAFKGNGKIG
jgi:hypothetical protein